MKELPKYDYPMNVITAAMMQKYARYGVNLKIRAEDCTQVGSLDAQKRAGKTIFGSGLLLCERAAAERAAAERAAAERAAAERAAAERAAAERAAAERAAAERAAAERAAAVKWELSNREKAIIQQLGHKPGMHCTTYYYEAPRKGVVMDED